MRKTKIVTIVGTRPELIKLSEVIRKADLVFDHILVHTGQNYDYKLNKVFFEELGIREPDYFLDVVGNGLGDTIGNVIKKSYELLSEIKPDGMIVLGDTNSGLCVIPAKRLKIPIIHLEAGNRCFDEFLPEEINRKIIDHTSDINLCYSSNAKMNLIKEGLNLKDLFVVGSPMGEVIECNLENIKNSNVLSRYNLSKGGYFVLSAHREENIDIENNFVSLMESINYIAKEYDLPIIYSVHPRSKKYIEQREFVFHKNVILTEPFGFFDYINLQMNSACVISDSGTLAEESSILGFPAVSIRTSTERQEGVDTGVFTLGNIDEFSLINAIRVSMEFSNISVQNTYATYGFSKKVINIVQGFSSVVNRVKWKKESL